MNYRDPELRDRLAAEYVLGTLHGRARARFERLLLDDHLLRGDVERWERLLNSMTLELEPRTPRARVWRRIERRIAPAQAPRPGWAWPFAAVTATAAATLLAIYVAFVPPETRTLEPEFVATIGAEADGPRWSIAADLDTRRLSIRALQPASVEPDQDLELWLLPAAERAPISLGLLPERGRREYPLPADAAGAAADAAGVAISREPAGGSPTGAPTGPVLYQGRLLAL